MSWIRSAVHRAVEAGGNNNITRTVRSYADTVVSHAGNAVVGGAKIIQDRIGPRNMQSLGLTVKRLEEVSVSCRGAERVQLLRRWLVALREVERLTVPYSVNNEKDGQKYHDHLQLNSEKSKDSPRGPVMVYYVDPAMPGKLMNFRDVFLHSQALEGIALSMILEAPNEEEVRLLVELFGLCLKGGKDVHEAVMKNIQDLATVFSKYQDEVLARREELLQYAQGAIAGLKMNADLARIDTEAHYLMEKLDTLKIVKQPLGEDDLKSSERTSPASTEALQDVLEQIQTFLKLEALFLKKRGLKNGASSNLHAERVDKLKVLSESLVNSTAKAEKRILDHRFQKEEALNYRVAKTNEVGQLEKDIELDMKNLQARKDELEDELKKVNAALTAVHARLRNAREEGEKFDEASNQVLVLLKSKEDELSRSICSCRIEADVVNRWTKFLEDSWTLQSACTEQNEKQINVELERYGDHFVDLVFHLLSAYKDQLEPSIPVIRDVVTNLQSKEKSGNDNEATKPATSRKQFEKRYLDLEVKFVTTLSVVDAMKKPFYSQTEGISRKDDQRVKDLFNALDKIKEEFESIERPLLEIESPTRNSMSPATLNPHRTFSVTDKRLKDSDAEINELGLHLDDAEDYPAEEIHDWEFDAFEKDTKNSD